MRIKSFTMSNCKCFKTEQRLSLDNELTTLVGPNGGGKSTLMDSLAVVMRNVFFPTFTTVTQQNGRREIKRHTMGDPAGHFPKHWDQPNLANRAQVSLVVTEVDKTNLEYIKKDIDKLSKLAHEFDDCYAEPKDLLRGMLAAELCIGDVLTYQVDNATLEGPQAPKEKAFHDYLTNLNYFLVLDSLHPDTTLRPAFFYLPPNRSASNSQLSVSLSRDRFLSELAGFSNQISTGSASLLKAACLFLAERHRLFERFANTTGYEERWSMDPALVEIRKRLHDHGFDLDIDVRDFNQNDYRFALKKENRVVNVDLMSTGEKEYFNMVLGLIALGATGGVCMIEEPEVHLHPQWQATIRDLLLHLCVEKKCQVIISTHSTAFISSRTLLGVRRVARADNEGSKITSIAPSEIPDAKDLLHILTPFNNERMFFVDTVALVEGSFDRVIMGRLIDLVRIALEVSATVEVVDVHGKANFVKYWQLLKQLAVNSFVVADLDYLNEIGEGDIRNLFKQNVAAVADKVLGDKKSKDRKQLCGELSKAIATSDLKDLSALWAYICARHVELVADTQEKQKAVESEIEKHASCNVFVLSRGELDDYVPVGFAGVDGALKLTAPLEMEAWLTSKGHEPHVEELLKLCWRIVGGRWENLPAARGLLVAVLKREISDAV